MDPILEALEAAARDRRTCRIGRVAGPAGGSALREAQVVRVEGSGVVLNVAGHLLRLGDEVQLWVATAEGPRVLDGVVARVGVAVPDRGPDGLLISSLRAAAPAAAPTGATLGVTLPGGGHLDLLEGPGAVVRVELGQVVFHLPADHRVVFPPRARIRLLLGCSADDLAVAEALVVTARREGPHVVYTADVLSVSDRAAFHAAVDAMRA